MLSRSEQERRAVAAAMAEPEVARLLGAEATKRPDAAVEDGKAEVADVWNSIAAACSEGLVRLEAFGREVDDAFSVGEPARIIEDPPWWRRIFRLFRRSRARLAPVAVRAAVVSAALGSFAPSIQRSGHQGEQPARSIALDTSASRST